MCGAMRTAAGRARSTAMRAGCAGGSPTRAPRGYCGISGAWATAWPTRSSNRPGSRGCPSRIVAPWRARWGRGPAPPPGRGLDLAETLEMGHSGIVYLLHFERCYRHARHYIGFTQNLEQRLAQHRAGRGSPLVAGAIAEGIDLQPAAIWEGNRHDERRLHRQKNTRARLCPLCIATEPAGGQPPIDLVDRARAQRARRDRPAGDADRARDAAAPSRKAHRKRPRPPRAARAARTGVEDVAARRDRLDDRPAGHEQRVLRATREARQ